MNSVNLELFSPSMNHDKLVKECLVTKEITRKFFRDELQQLTAIYLSRRCESTINSLSSTSGPRNER